ncbi:phosphonate utilization associated putative membrane protein [uncultured Ruminococcus sp.]|nr:phosphonate utilization associated putative membrane protein [uncultured Ruminococcus sp.]SCH31189.1 phosphonate utilization associated putative membrane protein [uncultured Clostridium sp.]
MWFIAAVLSSFFAGITTILAKCGIQKTDSALATAIRTGIVLIFSWLMVFLVGSFDDLSAVSTRSLFFLVLSGIATGASWLCYFKALSIGNVNRVVAIDKSSAVLSVLLAIVFFQETNHLAGKLAGTVLLAVGILLMAEQKKTAQTAKERAWIIYAVLSAVFAALTSILAKVGITGVESNLGTAIRTGVVLIMAWGVVFSHGKQTGLRSLERKELLFIVLSGLSTGASWLCYYYALQNGIVSVIVPIDRLSIVVSVLFSFLVFKERLSRRALIGLLLMIVGTLIIAYFA